MTIDDRDRRVKELFERVLDAPPGDRGSILDAETGDPSLADDVRALLRHEAGLGAFLETSAAERVLGAGAAQARLAPGDVVADFTVTAVLGEGGGGVVYEARQREPERRVALKVIRVGARSEDALRRFRDEAANLARLHHAAIAHVYAAGVLDDGSERRPWIAMEEVRGARSIVRHVREAGLPRDEALRLFVAVCEALHHAHENGVIHRDVTPGNVLVDGEGRPKVVDFGVACGAGDERAADAVGTLAYASPEQLTAGSARVDRRADVYGLGAVLYEMLTGTTPHDVEALPAAQVAETKRTVRVPAPSTRAPGVPRDLDAIVLRALAPAREDRYATAAELGADVARFLAHEPVAAHGGGTWYALGKFVRRRRGAAAAIGAVAAALVAGTAVSVWFAVENASARAQAERRSYVAEVSAAAAAIRVDDIAEARRRLEQAPEGLREWEWRHLVSRLDGSRATTSFPGRELWGGSISADGALLALAGQDRGRVPPVRFAAVARPDGTVLREWTSPLHDVPACDVAPDGSRFAAGMPDGSVLLHDVASGASRTLEPPHTGRVIAVAFAPDGARFATASADGTARIWSSEAGGVLHTLDGQGGLVVCAAFDAAGSRLATGSRDGGVRLWDAASGALLRVIPGHEGSVEGVSFSPDGARLASASRDRTVRLWDLDAGNVVAVGRSHGSNVRAVAFDPRGGAFVSASWDGTLRAWDAGTGAETGLLRGHGAAVTAVRFTGREPRLVSFSWDGTVKRWDPERTDVATLRGLVDQVDALAFDPEGRRVAAGCHDGRVTILDAQTARAPVPLGAPGAPVVGAGFVDARTLVVLRDPPALEVWDVPTDGGAAALARSFALPEKFHRSMRVDRARRAAWVTSSADETVVCVDLATGAVLEKRRTPVAPDWIDLDGHGGMVVAARDGRVGYASADGVWRTAQPGREAVRSVAFDAAGGRVVTATEGGLVRVLRVPDLATLLVLRGHSADAYQAAFLPGGRRIVSASRDHTVRLWDAADGECMLVLADHGYPVTSLAVSPDGSRIAAASGTWGDEQTTVKVWAAPADPR